MGQMDLIFQDYGGNLASWSLSDITAWAAQESVIDSDGAGAGGAVVIPGSPTTILFAVDNSKQVAPFVSALGSAWAPQAPFGSDVAGSVTAAIVPGTSVVQVFYRDAAGQVTSWWQTWESAWQGPQYLGVPAAGNIAAIRIPGTEILQLFYRAASGGVMTLWRDTAGVWHEQAMGGLPLGDIAVANVPGSNAIKIFYHSVGAVMTRERGVDGTWTAEQPLGGSPVGDIAAAILPPPAADVLQIFYPGGPDGGVQTMWRDPATGAFNAGSPMGGAVPAGPLTAARIPGTQTLGVFYVGSDGYRLLGNYRPASGVWTGATLPPTGPLEVVVMPEASITAVPVTQPFAEVPATGLGSNNNYFMCGQPVGENSQPLINLAVHIEVTEDIIGSIGFAFQLNCLSLNPTVHNLGPAYASRWQQYNLRVYDSNQLNWHIENSDSVTNPKPWIGVINVNANCVELPHTNLLPAGWRLSTCLLNDAQGNVNEVQFIITDASGAVTHVTKQLIGLTGDLGPATQSDLAPIVAATLNFVGPTGGHATLLTSGAGVITYECRTPMYASKNMPPDAYWAGTAETANSSYSELPIGADYLFTQTFGT